MACYEKPTGPCSKAQPGALNLYAYVLARSPDLAGNGVYACRPPRGAASGFSAHAEGRAFDINAAIPNTSPKKPDGRPIPQGGAADIRERHWIGLYVQHWQALGVQRIIYQFEEWRCDRGWTKTSQSLGKLHLNHCHTELTRESARTLTVEQITAALEGEDDMFTDADRALVTETRDLLKQYFGLNPDGTAKDIRAKIDANYIALYGTDHPELPAGQLKALVEGTKPPKTGGTATVAVSP